MSILIAILIFGLIIVAHELGHFIAAKLTGIRVHEFSVGMGPALFKLKKGETIYSLRLLPIGGFNRLAGMDGEEEADGKGFNQKPVKNRMAVIISGSMMNFLLGIILFIIVFMVLGIPSNSTIIGGVIPGSPAEQAGLQEGDKIKAIDNKNTQTWMEIVQTTQESPEKDLELLVEREGKTFILTVNTTYDPTVDRKVIGIEQLWKKQGFFESIVSGVKQAVGIIIAIIVILGQMITGQVQAEVAGPVGIVHLVGEAAQFGLPMLLNFTALLSVNIGLINLLPIPALDGSRMIFLSIEGIRGKPIAPDKENLVHFIGFAFLISLMLLITYQDILRVFE